MKTQICTIILLTFTALSALNATSGVSYATYATLENRKGGGGIELALPVGASENPRFRVHTGLNLYLPDEHALELDLLTLSVRVMFLSHHDRQHITYGFARSEGGIILTSGLNPFADPFIIEVGGGAGFEYRFSEHNAWFSEFGGGMLLLLPDDETLSEGLEGSYVMMSVGLRHYL
ncbi:MAG: hypothetical protein JXK93_13635 [Sphaerochaetaceae bacterium]|nr:hypothetical protein [Sphaerochaetaceae bacterium]